MAFSTICKTQDVSILLMGITGSGKSATGNAILGRKQFESRGGLASVTGDFHVGIKVIDGKAVRVVDVPGFKDTDNKDQLGLVTDAVTRSLIQVRNGFDAVLLVVPYVRRLTDDDKDCFMGVITCFDAKAFKDHGIVIITYGDNFRADNGNMDVQEWMCQANQQWLSSMCNNRAILFDNRTEDKNLKKDQVDKLMNMIFEFRIQGKYIPTICTLEGDEYDEFVKWKVKLIGYERTIHEVEILHNLLFGGVDTINIEVIKQQTELVVDLVIKNEICNSSDPTIKSLLESAKKLDVFHTNLSETRLSCIDMQLKIESKMIETGYWKQVKSKITNMFLTLPKNTKKKCNLM